MSILKLDRIRKHFEATIALDGVDFALARGEVHALIGENGAGKSTLMNVLAGAFRQDSGVMELKGQNYSPVAVGTELDIIVAVVIGGGSLNGGQGTILGAMIGALIMAFLRNGCQQMGWANYVQEIIIGAIIVLAVALDQWRNRQSV